MRTDAATAAPRPRSGIAGPLAFAATFLLCFLLLVARGHENAGMRSAAIINALVLVVNAGILAGVYILAGFGLGRPITALLRSIPGLRDAEATVGDLWLQAGLGVGAMLWLSHLLGMLGELSGPMGTWVAWGTIVIGLALLADQVVRGPLRPEKWPPLPLWAVLSAPALAVLFAAACSPPGALWLGARSEGGAYDVLSYHLQLPKEWIAPGSRLWPLQHNVYSFLPSYMEAAFLHLGALSRGGNSDGGSFVAGSGLGVSASQFLHAWMALFTALFTARAVRALSARPADMNGALTLPAAVAGAAVIAVPWVVVAGSLAYNDLGVTAALGAAILVSLERSWSPIARGIGVGFLVGIACSVKPTALFMGAPVAALFLFFSRPMAWRERFNLASAGAPAGLLALAPWLLRNWLAAGNPVFPFAHRLFGDSHWTAEQMSRYLGAHAFHGSVAERFALFFDADRGILNEQWAVLFPLGALAIGALVARGATRRAGALLLIGVAIQIAAWLFLTHIQSRFLLPTVVPFAIALGLAVGELIRWVATHAARATRATRRAPGHPLVHLAMAVGALVPLSLAAWSWLIFISQRAGHPNQLLAIGGVESLTGHAYARDFAQLDATAQKDALKTLPTAPFINFSFGPDDSVYFLGIATPLYFLPPGGVQSVVYHTTWDRSPLGDAMRAHPDDPKAWTAAIRASRNGPPVEFVLVDFDELSRLTAHTDLHADHKDSWFDPDVTPERLRRWLGEECEVVRAWSNGAGGGTYLFRLHSAPATGDRR